MEGPLASPVQLDNSRTIIGEDVLRPTTPRLELAEDVLRPDTPVLELELAEEILRPTTPVLEMELEEEILRPTTPLELELEEDVVRPATPRLELEDDVREPPSPRTLAARAQDAGVDDGMLHREEQVIPAPPQPEERRNKNSEKVHVYYLHTSNL